MIQQSDNPILAVKGLKTYFPIRRGLLGRRQWVRAVDGVDLAVGRGRTLGLVGESGSGKTTVGRTILRLLPAYAGSIVFDGRDVLAIPPGEMRALRKRMQIIFQDPVSSLDPRMTVGDIVAEPLCVHMGMSRRQRRERVSQLLDRVGLAAGYATRYPHEFSGGQRQRIGIARALASGPDFIVCDEPVSALDVSVQAQILNLLSDLQDELGISYLFIAHNLAVVEHFADEVAVMYLGKIVELAGRDDLYAKAVHPYTRSLLSAVPRPDPARRSNWVRLSGETPSPVNPPAGCPFHPRCPLTRQLAGGLGPNQTTQIICDGRPAMIAVKCCTSQPVLGPLDGNPAHLHACHFAGANYSRSDNARPA
ncbi:MAG: ATP-binding cassette domain-containing protein [Planctomycetes bacterium]|nr:ATP-binding cassette domain-containing protein [Planctomycetota bacterium]